MKNTKYSYLLISLIIILFTGCDGSDSSRKSTEKSKTPNQAEVPQKKESWKGGSQKKGGKGFRQSNNKKKTNVRLKEIKPETLKIQTTYVGSLLPFQRVLMRSQIDGVIENINFEEGDEITKEKRLIDISTKELQLKLKISIADSNLAEINIKRDEKLASSNLISSSQLDQTRTRAESARLNKELARISLKKSLISSPLDGTVKTKHVKVGEFVRKGDKLVEILDLSRVIVKVNIPELEILEIKIGQKVEIALYIMEEIIFSGEVKNIGLEADSNNRTFPVEIHVSNSERMLRPGMLARSTFTKSIDDEQIVIPRHTILEKERGRVVYVFDKGKVFQRDIQVGLSQKDQVQVIKGLKEGELIVVEGHNKLSDGEEVNVVN
jgi:membrane fusion protein (multidrug efflux system)